MYMTKSDKITISNSQNREDYEILIKQKYNSGYLAYCPQLNKLLRGNTFEAVYNNIDKTIIDHITYISAKNKPPQ